MAETAIMGKDGEVRVGNKIIGYLDAWSIQRSIGVAEITAFGSTWEDHDPTIRSWTASISGTYAHGSTQQEQIRDQLENAALANVAVLFMLGSNTSTRTYSGNAIVASDSIQSGLKDRVSWSAELRGDGALTYTS